MAGWMGFFDLNAQDAVLPAMEERPAVANPALDRLAAGREGRYAGPAGKGQAKVASRAARDQLRRAG